MRSHCLIIDSTRCRVSHGGFGSRPEKYMLYSASSRFSSASIRGSTFGRSFGVFWGGCCFAMPLAGNQQPNEWKPQLACVGDGAIVDENFRVRRAPDDSEQ